MPNWVESAARAPTMGTVGWTRRLTETGSKHQSISASLSTNECLIQGKKSLMRGSFIASWHLWLERKSPDSQLTLTFISNLMNIFGSQRMLLNQFESTVNSTHQRHLLKLTMFSRILPRSQDVSFHGLYWVLCSHQMEPGWPPSATLNYCPFILWLEMNQKTIVGHLNILLIWRQYIKLLKLYTCEASTSLNGSFLMPSKPSQPRTLVTRDPTPHS